MKTIKIVNHVELERTKQMFFNELDNLNKESARINKVIEDRIRAIKKINSDKHYIQTVNSNIK